MLVPTANQIADYRKAKLRTARANRFGLEMGGGRGKKGKPVHRNTRNDPRPVVLTNDEGTRYRKEATTSKKNDLEHITGKRAIFHVSNGNGREQRYALDFDGDGSVPYDRRAEIARRLVARLWPELTPYIETSRSRTGCYAWLRVKMPRVDSQLANLIERIVNRELRERLHHQRERLHLDALKGCAGYETGNPHFDEELANSLWPRSVTEFEVEPGVWLERREAKRYLRALGSPRKLADLSDRQRWVKKTRLQHYEENKAFYGIDFETGEVERKARIVFNKRLEQNWKQFGTLVTDMAYGQPERLAEATAWLSDKRGCMTLLQFVAFMPRWIQDLIRQVRDGELGHREAYRRYLSHKKSRTVKLAGPARTQSGVTPTPNDCIPPVGEPVQLPLVGIDIACLHSPEAWDGYGAAARLALRSTGGDLVKTHRLAMVIYEQRGQATGFDYGDRAKRRDDLGRCLDHWVQTFDVKLAKARRGQNLDSLPYVKHLGRIARELDPRVPQFVLDHHCQVRPKARTPITVGRKTMLEVMAVVLAHTAHNIHTGNLREVPSTSILAGLRAENARRRRAKKKLLPADEKHVAAALDVLEAAGVLAITRGHHAQSKQCTQRALGQVALRMRSLAWLLEVTGGREHLQVAPGIPETEVAAAFMPRWNREQIMRRMRAQYRSPAADANAAAGACVEARGWVTAAEEAMVAAVVKAHLPPLLDNPFTPSLRDQEQEHMLECDRLWREEVIFGSTWKPDREVA